MHMLRHICAYHISDISSHCVCILPGESPLRDTHNDLTIGGHPVCHHDLPMHSLSGQNDVRFQTHPENGLLPCIFDFFGAVKV